MEVLVVVLGMIITIVPVIYYFSYLLRHINGKTKFDYHIDIVKDKKGFKGVVIAYLEQILLAFLVTSFGLLMSNNFDSDILLKILIITLILFIIVKYFDERNEK